MKLACLKICRGCEARGDTPEIKADRPRHPLARGTAPPASSFPPLRRSCCCCYSRGCQGFMPMASVGHNYGACKKTARLMRRTVLFSPRHFRAALSEYVCVFVFMFLFREVPPDRVVDSCRRSRSVRQRLLRLREAVARKTLALPM